MRTRRSILAGLLIGVAAAGLALAAARTSFFQGVENNSYDLRVARVATPVDPASPVVFIQIDDSSIAALEPIVGGWPWPRMIHAGLVDYLAQAGARTIAYDVLFLEEERRGSFTVNGQSVTSETSDQMLVEAVRRAGNVIVLGDATYEGSARASATMPDASMPLPGPAYQPGPGFQSRPGFRAPFPALLRAAAGIGHNLQVHEDDGSDNARRMLPFLDTPRGVVPSLGMAAALHYLRVSANDVAIDGGELRAGTRRLPLIARPAPDATGARSIPSRQSLLRFSEPVPHPDGVTSMFPGYAFFDVLLSGDQMASGKAPAIPPSAFKDKLVFIGTSAAGLHDRYATPFRAGAAGVELHATLADNVLSERVMRVASRRSDLAITIGVGVLCGLVAALMPVSAAIAIVLGVVGALAWWVTRGIGHGVWMAAVMPTFAAAVALFGGVAWQYLVEGRAKREMRQMFGRYVSKDVIDQLVADPLRAALGGQRRDMTVLFSDIRGFTTASEAGTPEAVVRQLNEYFGAMVEVLFRHQGTLDKFVGDMVMGLFGAPLDDPHHADHAVAAALEMSRELARLNEGWRASGQPVLDIGIGINSGEMIAGNIGSTAIMSYTVIGDAVNLGSRLESLNKDYRTHILISEATRARLTIDVRTRPIGEVTVKGRQQPVLVHEVLA